MYKKLLVGLCAVSLSALISGCAADTTTNTANTNTTNANTETVNTNTAPTTAGAPVEAPDDSEVVTTEVGGVTTQTRRFRNTSSRIERVEVTTPREGGKRRARVYYRSGEVRDLPDNEVEEALEATGDALVKAGGVVVDKTKEVAGEVKEGAEPVVEKVGEGAKKAGEATVDGAKAVGKGARNVGEKVVEGTKTGVKKAGEGAKKAGGAIKDAVTP